MLGLDLSLTGCGLAVWDGRRLLRSRLLETKPLSHQGRWEGPRRLKGTDEERIEFLRLHIVRSIRKFEPKLVIIEGHAFNARGRGVSILHELHGVIKNEIHRRGIPYSVEAPTRIKAMFAGNGRASKADVQAAALMVCGKELSEDEADAFGCAWYGYANLKTLTE